MDSMSSASMLLKAFDMSSADKVASQPSTSKALLPFTGWFGSIPLVSKLLTGTVSEAAGMHGEFNTYL